MRVSNVRFTQLCSSGKIRYPQKSNDDNFWLEQANGAGELLKFSKDQIIMFMSTPEERQWRSYLKAKEIQSRRHVPTIQEREKMFRENARRQLRSMYEQYPMVAYVRLKQDDSIYSPKLKAEHEKSREELKARMQEMKAEEAKAFEELKAKYPKIFKDMQEQEKQTSIDGELYNRIYQEELEKLKTLPVVRKNPVKELLEYIKFKVYVIRHFGLHYKTKVIKFVPEELGDWGKQK